MTAVKSASKATPTKAGWASAARLAELAKLKASQAQYTTQSSARSDGSTESARPDRSMESARSTQSIAMDPPAKKTKTVDQQQEQQQSSARSDRSTESERSTQSIAMDPPAKKTEQQHQQQQIPIELWKLGGFRTLAVLYGSRTSFSEPSLKRRFNRSLKILGDINLDA